MLDRVAVIFFACNLLSQSFQYVFNVAMARLLGPEEFRVFTSLFSLMMYVGIPLAAFQNVVTQSVATWVTKEQYALVGALWKRTRRDGLIFGGVAGVVILLSAGYLRDLFHLTSRFPLVVLATIPLSMVLLPTARGALMGAQQFLPLGLNLVMEAGGRVLIGVGLVMMNLKASGGLAATTGSSLLALVGAVWVLRPILNKAPVGQAELKMRELYGFAVPVMLTQLGFTAMTFMDGLIVSARFPQEGGYYLAAETLGKVVFFLPTPLTALMFPRVAALEAKGLPTWPTMLKTLGMTAGMCLSVVGGYALFPEFVLHYSVGSQYGPTIPFLVPMGLAMTGFTMTNVLLMYHVSRKSLGFLPWYLGLTLLQAWALMTMPQSSLETVWMLIGCAAAQLGLQLGLGYRSSRPSVTISPL